LGSLYTNENVDQGKDVRIFMKSEATETLNQLGLTTQQAKIYLSLLETSTTTAKGLSKRSRTARQATYRLLEELEEKGLVERTITSPIMFTAMPLEDSLPILIKRKKNQISETQKNAIILLKKIRGKNLKKLPMEEPYFCLISEKEANLLRIRKALSSSKETVDIITTSNRFKTFAPRFGEDIGNALKRCVTFRIIVEKSINLEILRIVKDFFTTENVKNLNSDSSLILRHTSAAPLSPMWIFDAKEVVIDTSLEGGLGESPTLWSNTPSLVTVFRDYFETKWITAFENTVQQEKPRISSKLR
jgi:sugar-specific transcriptional regulator TrmB